MSIATPLSSGSAGRTISLRFPHVQHGRRRCVRCVAVAGPVRHRPHGWPDQWAVQSAEASGLKDLLPTPPVFGIAIAVCRLPTGCSGVAVLAGHPARPALVSGRGHGMLESAVRHNPWVGEPQMVLAQLPCRWPPRTMPSRPPAARCTCWCLRAIRGTSACSGTPGWPGRACCCKPPAGPGQNAWTTTTTSRCAERMRLAGPVHATVAATANALHANCWLR